MIHDPRVFFKSAISCVVLMKHNNVMRHVVVRSSYIIYNHFMQSSNMEAFLILFCQMCQNCGFVESCDISKGGVEECMSEAATGGVL